MFCPECRGEFREGITRCANCEVDLVSERPQDSPFGSPEKMAAMLADKDLEAVWVGSFAAVTEKQKQLAVARIPSIIAPEEGQEIRPGLHARLYLMVDPADLERVREFFARHLEQGLAQEGLMLEGMRAEPQGTEACPACGAQVPQNVAECPDCGLMVGIAEEE